MNGDARPRRDIQDRAFRFACRVVALVEALLTQGGAGRLIAPQLLDCGTSIGANLEEAEAGQSKADFVAKASVSRKESREALYWLRLLAACRIQPAARLAPLIAEADQLVAIITTIVRNARRSLPPPHPRSGRLRNSNARTE